MMKKYERKFLALLPKTCFIILEYNIESSKNKIIKSKTPEI